MAAFGTGVLALLSALTVLPTVYLEETVCTKNHDITCVNAVKDVIEDVSLFWFGTDYASKCPQGNDFVSGCGNVRPGVNDSLITRMLARNDVTANSVKFVVDVTYTLPAKRSYMGCGAMVNQSTPEPTFLTIDPISRLSVLPYDVSTEPSVTWPAENGVKYTAVYYDVGFPVLHGMYVNVEGGDISLGQVAVPHSGPKNPQERPTPHLWVVFVQQEALSLSEVIAYVNSHPTFDGNFMSPFLAHFDLTGPVGINIVRSTTDEYAAVFMRSRGVVNKCPMYYQKRVQELVDSRGGLTFDISSPPATKSIDLKFISPPESFSSCCKTHKLGNVNKTIDFKTSSVVMGSEVRGQPRFHIVPEWPAYSLPGQFFTLLIVDPSQEFSTSAPKTIVHWLVVNIPSNNVTSGHEILSYLPLASGKNDRIFLLMLYKQTTKFNERIMNTTGLSGTDCSYEFKNRCKFRVSDFVERNNLVLDGVRELKVIPDAYSRYRQVKMKVMTEREACSGVTSYEDPCPWPTGRGRVFRSNVSTVLFLVLITVFGRVSLCQS